MRPYGGEPIRSGTENLRRPRQAALLKHAAIVKDGCGVCRAECDLMHKVAVSATLCFPKPWRGNFMFVTIQQRWNSPAPLGGAGRFVNTSRQGRTESGPNSARCIQTAPARFHSARYAPGWGTIRDTHDSGHPHATTLSGSFNCARPLLLTRHAAREPTNSRHGPRV